MTKEVEKVLRAHVLCSIFDPRFQDPIQDHTLHFVVDHTLHLMPGGVPQSFFVCHSTGIFEEHWHFWRALASYFIDCPSIRVFSQLDSDHELWAEMLHALCSQCLIRMPMVSVFSTTGDINNRHFFNWTAKLRLFIITQVDFMILLIKNQSVGAPG